MTFEFTLPDVGEGVSEGELVSWLVEEGDTVTEDQPVAEVETDKALVEIPSPVDGSVREQRFDPGDIIPVGDVFITFDVEGEPVEEPAEAEDEGAATEATEAEADADRVFAAPSVRRLARELGVPIETVDGSGPGGRISEADVQAAADGDQPDEAPAETASTASTAGVEAAGRERTLAVPATRGVAREAGIDLNDVPASDEVDGEAFVSAEDVRAFAEGGADPAEPAGPTSEGAVEHIPYRGVRRTIGQQMEKSMFTAPHVTHHELIRVDDLVETREELKAVAEEEGVKLTYLPFVVKALIAALREHPVLNAELDEEAGHIELKQYYNIGIATATEAGLMVPVLKDADKKGMLELASESRDLAQQARDRTISPEDFQDGTITITNFGAIGGDFATPILNYPEVAIVGLGELKQRPVVEDGEVVAAWTLPLSITIDHRVIDGAEVAEFATTLGGYLSDPRRLLLG